MRRATQRRQSKRRLRRCACDRRQGYHQSRPQHPAVLPGSTDPGLRRIHQQSAVARYRRRPSRFIRHRQPSTDYRKYKGEGSEIPHDPNRQGRRNGNIVDALVLHLDDAGHDSLHVHYHLRPDGNVVYHRGERQPCARDCRIVGQTAHTHAR